MNPQFVCALSGIKAQEEELEDIDFPDGWIELRMTRRYVNPKWDAIQYVKAGLVQQYLQNIPKDQREEQIMAITIQVEAQFAMIEAQTEQYVEEEITKYIANPDNNPALMAEYQKLLKMLAVKAPKTVKKTSPEKLDPQIEQMAKEIKADVVPEEPKKEPVKE